MVARKHKAPVCVGVCTACSQSDPRTETCQKASILGWGVGISCGEVCTCATSGETQQRRSNAHAKIYLNY